MMQSLVTITYCFCSTIYCQKATNYTAGVTLQVQFLSNYQYMDVNDVQTGRIGSLEYMYVRHCMCI